MTRTQFDNNFSLFQLSEIIQSSESNSQTKKILKTFSCSRNRDLEDFLHNKAVTFEKHFRARTYIYIDNDTKEVAAYFTIAISMLYTDNISSKTIKMLDGYKDDVKTIPCFLIGQLGKSDRYKKHKIGMYILEDSVDIIDKSHKTLGGRFILLDAINNKKVISFYKNNLFFPIEKIDTQESIKMIRPYFEN
jgi:hypothetical protein